MRKQKVSVVIPVYNESTTIVACLEALLRQTTKPYEIIVIDNNSTDDTIKKAARYPEVTIIKEKRAGSTYARFAGFHHAHGDIIGSIDADTIVSPNWVQSIAQSFDDHHTVGIVGATGIRELSPKNRFVGTSLHRLRRRMDELFYHTPTWLYGHNMAVRKNAWDKVEADLCPDIPFLEDLDITLHLQSVGKTVFAPQVKAKIKILNSISPKKQIVYQGYIKEILGRHRA